MRIPAIRARYRLVASIFSVGPCECSLLGDSLSDSDSYSRVTCAMGLVDATATPRRTLGPEKRRLAARAEKMLSGRTRPPPGEA